jgi:phosphoribosyl 1,2-cyclic phosphodiesterase
MLWCLGVGEGWPSPDRRHSSFLYRLGGRWILLDAGEGLSQAYCATGLSYNDLDHIFLSHMHSDHVGSFSMFLQGMWLAGRRRPLPISAPAKAIPQLKSWLNHTVLFPELLGFRLRWSALIEKKPIRSGSAAITPFPTRHLESLARSFKTRYPETCFESFSFVVSWKGRRIAHTADIGAAADLDPLTAKPLDLLTCELSHVDSSEIFARLRGRAIGQIVFTHLRRELWNSRPALRRDAQRALGRIPFRFARDGDRIEF